MSYKPPQKRYQQALKNEPWLTSTLIQGNEVKGKLLEVLKKVDYKAAPEGTVTKLVCDGHVSVKAVFTEKALQEFSQNDEDCTPPEWDRALIIVRQGHPKHVPNKDKDLSEFILVVDDFAQWTTYEGYWSKQDIFDCMAVDAVKKKSDELWRTWIRETEEESCGSIPLSQLLEQLNSQSIEMWKEADDDAEDELHVQSEAPHKDKCGLWSDEAGTSRKSVQSKIPVDLSSNFTADNFIIPDNQQQVLSQIEEWKSDYIPPIEVKDPSSITISDESSSVTKDNLLAKGKDTLAEMAGTSAGDVVDGDSNVVLGCTKSPQQLNFSEDPGSNILKKQLSEISIQVGEPFAQPFDVRHRTAEISTRVGQSLEHSSADKMRKSIGKGQKILEMDYSVIQSTQADRNMVPEFPFSPVTSQRPSAIRLNQEIDFNLNSPSIIDETDFTLLRALKQMSPGKKQKFIEAILEDSPESLQTMQKSPSSVRSGASYIYRDVTKPAQRAKLAAQGEASELRRLSVIDTLPTVKHFLEKGKANEARGDAESVSDKSDAQDQTPAKMKLVSEVEAAEMDRLSRLKSPSAAGSVDGAEDPMQTSFAFEAHGSDVEQQSNHSQAGDSPPGRHSSTTSRRKVNNVKESFVMKKKMSAEVLFLQRSPSYGKSPGGKKKLYTENKSLLPLVNDNDKQKQTANDAECIVVSSGSSTGSQLQKSSPRSHNSASTRLNRHSQNCIDLSDDTDKETVVGDFEIRTRKRSRQESIDSQQSVLGHTRSTILNSSPQNRLPNSGDSVRFYIGNSLPCYQPRHSYQSSNASTQSQSSAADNHSLIFEMIKDLNITLGYTEEDCTMASKNFGNDVGAKCTAFLKDMS